MSPAQGKQSVAHALESFPVATVRTNAEYKAFTEDEVNGFLGFLYVMLGMAVVISLFGIVNTLALSVFERTRKSACCRPSDDAPPTAPGGALRERDHSGDRWNPRHRRGLAFGWILGKELEDQASCPRSPTACCSPFWARQSSPASWQRSCRLARARLNVLEALQYESPITAAGALVRSQPDPSCSPSSVPRGRTFSRRNPDRSSDSEPRRGFRRAPD